MANLSLDFDRLKADVGLLVGWGETSGDWSAAQSTRLGKVVNDGYRVFLNGGWAPGEVWRWSFLEPRHQMTLTAPYSDGTVTIASGVVTGDGTTFPSWAAQGQISISGGRYAVDTRDSNTQLTLEDLTVDADAGTSYSLERVTYDLKDDFGGFGEGPITLESQDLRIGCKTIQLTSEAFIRRQYDFGSWTDYPRLAAQFFKEVADSTSGDQKSVIEFWPPADRAYVVEFTYIVNPSELDSANNTQPLGGPRYHECIRVACLAQGEQQLMDGAAQVYTQRLYNIEFPNAVRYDQLRSRAQRYGPMADHSDDMYWSSGSFERPIPPNDVYTYSA